MATNLPEQLGIPLINTTAQAPVVKYAEPVPRCPVCAAITAIYKASDFHLQVDLKGVVAHPKMVEVITLTGSVVLRYSPPAGASPGIPGDWYLPSGSPLPSRMLLVLQVPAAIPEIRSVEVTIA